ncbi:L-threonylcarbamoyladenylate synthase [Euzebya tangerina]|uniref:L-threonylcarbamoyladenylate synthase n=1 Tax=Euzebya tangerina TaxID=591198 RepID=UPI000E3141F5|nr:L-threonylcarbamoyladenylate synthase [Euzebya tangerina]
MSETISLDDPDAAFDEAVAVLRKGSVVVLPVDGVYAVVADAFRPAATQRIFAARRRSRTTPIPVLIRSERQVSGLVSDVPESADRLMAAYWPGDLTLILNAIDGMSWDLGNGKGTVQLRRPVDDFVLRLIGEIGPLACTSANRPDQRRPTTAQDARQQLGVLVPVYLDGGESDGRVSTIVDATGPSLVVHREGVIAGHDIHLVAAGELPWGERPAPPPSVIDSEDSATDSDSASEEGPADGADARSPAGDASDHVGDAPTDSV